MIDPAERRAALGELLGAAAAFDDVDITTLALVGVITGGEVHYGTRTFRPDPRIDLGYLATAPYYSRLYAAGVEGPWTERPAAIEEAVAAGAIAMLGVFAEYSRLTVVFPSPLVVLERNPVEGSLIGGVPSVYVRLALPSGEMSTLVQQVVVEIVERSAAERSTIASVVEALSTERGYQTTALRSWVKDAMPYLVRTGLVLLDEVTGD